MQKLVVHYLTEEDRIPCLEHILCVEYESAATFLVDFEKALTDAIGIDETYVQMDSEWVSSEPIHYFPPTASEQVALTEWMRKRPLREPDRDEFTVAGEIFFVYHFLNENANYRPEVYELNEWFDKFKGRHV